MELLKLPRFFCGSVYYHIALLAYLSDILIISRDLVALLVVRRTLEQQVPCSIPDLANILSGS